MPKKYEAIRDKLERGGTPMKEAKTRAAKIYNSQRKKGEAPVTRATPKKEGKAPQRKPVRTATKPGSTRAVQSREKRLSGKAL